MTPLRPFHLILYCVPYWLLSRPFDLIFSLCTQMTPFKTIWPHFLYCVPNWLLSRPYDLILSLCTQLTHFKTIWPNFIIVYPIDSFQDHMTWYFHCVLNWLLSRPYDSIFVLCTPINLILSLCTQLNTFKTIWPAVCIVYSVDSFQYHMTQFYHCVPNWLLSIPYDKIFVLCTQLTPFKTIWPNFCIMYLLRYEQT